MTLKIDGAIFDLDGTVMDSSYAWAHYVSRYLRSRGVSAPPAEADAAAAPMSLHEVARYCMRCGAPGTEQENADGINAQVEPYYRSEVQPRPGAEAFLRGLRADGVAVCLATSTDRFLVETALRRCGLLDCFDRIFTCTEVGYNKTSPRIFEAARDFMGTAAGRTAVFEDASFAIASAKEAGFLAVGVRNGQPAADEAAIRSRADLFLGTFEGAQAFFSR